jgi:hypothetical protein
MGYIGKAVPLQGAYQKADNISSQFNGTYTSFNIRVGGVNKTIEKATNLIVGYTGYMGSELHSRMLLEPDVDYTVSGYTITFSSSNFKVPQNGDYCWITILGDVLSPNV